LSDAWKKQTAFTQIPSASLAHPPISRKKNKAYAQPSKASSEKKTFSPMPEKGEREVRSINGKTTSEYTSQEMTEDTHHHGIVNQSL